MDTSVLQQKLAQQRHLLPSQHELLNRLLFQLAFNDFQNIGLVGAEGSGKSTLALALAELFSEQANVALLSGPINETELEGQLQQHWFGQRQSEPALAELMAELPADSMPLLLIVDNFNLLSSSARQKLLQLDCLGFFMLAEPSADMALNLSINYPTLQDASQILKDKALDPLAIAERFAASGGNMHLLHSAIVRPEERKTQGAAFWLLPAAIVLLVLAVAINWLLPATGEQTVAVEPPTPAVAEFTPVPADNSEYNEKPERTELPEQNINSDAVSSPEPDNSPELPDFVQLEVDAAATDLTGLSDLVEGEASSEVTTTEQTVNAEQAVVTEQPVDTGLSNDVVVAEPAIESFYQEQQLLALSAGFRVLQLAVLSSEVAVGRFIQANPDTDIVVYQRSWQGQLQWIILAKDYYPDVESARQARAALPETLRAAGPFIKPVGQVQQEIKALARLRAESERQE